MTAISINSNSNAAATATTENIAAIIVFAMGILIKNKLMEGIWQSFFLKDDPAYEPGSWQRGLLQEAVLAKVEEAYLLEENKKYKTYIIPKAMAGRDIALQITTDQNICKKYNTLPKDRVRECDTPIITKVSYFEQKFEFTEESYEWDGHILHRIKAVRDFKNAKKGDLGGFIETEDNLSHAGDCWVADETLVYGTSRISGDAYIKAHRSGIGAIVCNSLIIGDSYIADGEFINCEIHDSCIRKGVHFTNCSITNCDIQGGDYSIMIDAKYCNFNNCNLNGGKFKNCSLNNCESFDKPELHNVTATNSRFADEAKIYNSNNIENSKFLRDVKVYNLERIKNKILQFGMYSNIHDINSIERIPSKVGKIYTNDQGFVIIISQDLGIQPGDDRCFEFKNIDHAIGFSRRMAEEPYQWNGYRWEKVYQELTDWKAQDD